MSHTGSVCVMRSFMQVYAAVTRHRSPTHNRYQTTSAMLLHAKLPVGVPFRSTFVRSAKNASKEHLLYIDRIDVLAYCDIEALEYWYTVILVYRRGSA